MLEEEEEGLCGWGVNREGRKCKRRSGKQVGRPCGALQATARSLDFRSDGEEGGKGKRENKGHL